MMDMKYDMPDYEKKDYLNKYTQVTVQQKGKTAALKSFYGFPFLFH